MIIRRPAQGFTLLELLIATTLMAMVVLLSAIALSITLKTLRRGTNALTQYEKRGFVRYKITSQIVSIRPYKLREKGRTVLFFSGGKDTIEFISSSPFNSSGMPGLYRVKLLFQKNSVYEQESRLLDDSHLRKDIQGEKIEAMKDIKGATLSYFDGYKRDWTNLWRRDYLPRAVKIQGEVKGRAWSIIIPILSGHKWSFQGEAS